MSERLRSRGASTRWPRSSRSRRPHSRATGSPAALLADVDFVLEELFTNMVKYSPRARRRCAIEIAAIAGGVEVTLTDYDVDRFDVTEAPEVDITLPLDQRRPGGLGLHLIRRLVDSVQYEYSEGERRSRIDVPQDTVQARRRVRRGATRRERC